MRLPTRTRTATKPAAPQTRPAPPPRTLWPRATPGAQRPHGQERPRRLAQERGPRRGPGQQQVEGRELRRRTIS
eukprot:14095822-Alexandrium_andersonii.AAC.1